MTLKNAVGFLVLGLSIGWLMGLSMSPVVGAVLAATMGAVASLVAAFSSGANDTAATAGTNKPRLAASPWPLALLVLAIAVGAPIGVKVRELGVLGAPPRGGRAASDTALVGSSDSNSHDTTRKNLPDAAGLYGTIAPEDCAILLASGKETLAQDFLRTGDPTLRAIGKYVTSRTALDSIRRDVCKPRGRNERTSPRFIP